MLLVFSSSKKSFSELHPDDFHLQGEQASAAIEQYYNITINNIIIYQYNDNITI